MTIQGPDKYCTLSRDESPEATAERIVGFALEFFNTYKVQNPGLNTEDLVYGFREEIMRGIKDGFSNVRQVLSGLGLLEGRMEAHVETTYKLVMSKLDKAFADILFRKEGAG